MVFRRIIYNALFVGLLAGLLLSAVQILTVNPIIFEAETFEITEPEGGAAGIVEAAVLANVEASHGSDVDGHGAHDHGAHEHSDEEWAPEDGTERTLYTVIANISAGIGFSAILLALMSQLQSVGVARLNVVKGVVWGVAGFVAFFVAPGLGLPPEIPGVNAAPVEHRQLWWVLAVACVGIGILVIAYAPLKLKAAGIIAIAIPYVVNAPHQTGPAFSHTDPAAVETLTALHQKFILASGASNLIFWLALGVISAWVLNRWVLKGLEADANTSV